MMTDPERHEPQPDDQEEAQQSPEHEADLEPGGSQSLDDLANFA